MGFRFRKSIKVMPGVKVNLGGQSASVSVGVKGLHKTFSTTGRTTDSVHIAPGMSYIKSSSSSTKSAEPNRESDSVIRNVEADMDHCKRCGKRILIHDKNNPDLCKDCRSVYDARLSELANSIRESLALIQNGQRKRDSSMLMELENMNAWKEEALAIRNEYNCDLNPIFKSVSDMTNQLFADMVNKDIKVARAKSEVDHNNREVIRVLKEDYKKFVEWSESYPNLSKFIDPAAKFLKNKLAKEEALNQK